jgi:CRP/FNR family cyclic AMP-dependent transcriptional regulator
MPPIIDFEVLRHVMPDTRAYKAGEIIFNAGDAGSEFFVIKEGSVGIRLGDRTIETLGRGEVFGEMALIDAKPRSATVVAETDCVVVPLGEKQFLLMVREAPYFALGVMRVLALRLRAANAAIRAG